MKAKRLHKILIIESSDHPKGLTLAKAYAILSELCKNEKEIVNFLLSEKGGYSEGEVNTYLYRKQLHRNRYSQKNIIEEKQNEYAI